MPYLLYMLDWIGTADLKVEMRKIKEMSFLVFIKDATDQMGVKFKSC